MDENTKTVALQAHADRSAYFHSLHEARLLDARAAVQAALLINGAAATAVLAFLGSVSASSTPHHVPKALVWALVSFGVGVFFAACTAVAAYVANHRYAEAVGAKRSTWVHPFIEPTEGSGRHDALARRFHTAAYVFVAGTLLAFVSGITAATVGFARLH